MNVAITRRFHRMIRFLLFAPVLVLLLAMTFPQSSNPPPPDTESQHGSADKTDKNGEKSAGGAMTKLKIHVWTDTDKPVANASVYVRFYTQGGILHHDKLAEMNFKTNQDGSVKVPEVPQGRILIQVIATGWHTYGKWYDVEKDEESIDIKLVPPPHWY
jgi:hypothetical protein